MTTEEEPDTLKIYWDHFFKAETGTYEKSTWLELFLAEFIVRLNEGKDAKELISFCPLSGVVTLVGCELLCGIHRVTSSVNTQYAPVLADSAPGPAPALAPLHVADANGGSEGKSEEGGRAGSLFSRLNAQSSTVVLRRYVLARAWRCLVLLRALGVEGLSCCRQLSSVLIWLFGETGSGALPALSAPAPPAPPAPRFPAPTSRAVRVPIQELFSNRIWSKQKCINSLSPKQNSQPSSDRTCTAARFRHNGQQKDSDSKIKKRSTKPSDHSSESGDSNDDLQILNRSMTIKICTPNDDFEYFNSPMRSSSDYPNQSLYSDPFYSPRKVKPKADDYMTDQHREIINSEISAFEFTLIITDLLQELCKAESSLSGSEGSQISMQCINFSLKNLCSLQFGSLPAQSAAYEPLELSRVKVALTELLIVSLDQVLVHSDLCAKLINNGILPMLLRVLEDVICKSSAKFNTKADRQSAKDNDKPDSAECADLLKFVFGIAYSITAFFHCLLMQCRSVEKLREFTDQFKLYGECLRGGLLKECIELMIRIPVDDKEETVILIKKLIDSIGKLISAMKRVRSEVIHSAACPRSRHKVCRQRVAAGMHHHHDILGEAGTGLPLPSACCVSVLYGTLASLVPDEEVSAEKVLRNRILRVMLKCGVCCCFSPSFLMESIVRLMLTHNSVAGLCLQLLEHTVYGDLGASVLIPKVTDQLPCSICEQSDDNKDLGRKYCPHGVSPMERKSVWSFLIHYNSLLQLDNHNNVLHATVSHLLKVTPKCRMEMKYELLFSVIYPTFIVAKHRYIIRMEEAAYFLTASCLNIFASLLNTVQFAEQFIQKGGLSYVLELISLSEFSNQCCAILEIAIIVEIFKLIKENAEFTYFREMSSLASVQMLFKSLSEMTEKCFRIYRMRMPNDKFEELCDLSKERELLAFTGERERTRSRKVSLPVTIKTSFAANENATEESAEDHVEVLKNAWTFWKSCAGLCLYSPMFREYAASEPVFAQGYALLKLLLHRLCRERAGAAEARALIKIMEALLTVQFAVSDATGGRSKETSCSVVRAALAARTRGGGAGLRALCDALIGVAVAKPSRSHAMPTLATLKVPPLFCPSGSSSPECSSSEESAAGPYASEHSEPRVLPDDGYEADVEITKHDVSVSMKSRKLSELSILSNVSGVQCEHMLGAECPEYSKGGELAHPELCVIVVDILSQLIDKILNEDETETNKTNENGDNGMEGGEDLIRVCGGLARAWAARLGGGRAPPLLLKRLLAKDSPPARLLSTTNPKYAELQSGVLELCCAAGARRVEACELRALLRLLGAPRPPLAPLLAALRALLRHAAPRAPDTILSFPTPPLPDDYSTEELVGSSLSQQAEITARRLRQAHLRSGAWSAWAAGAARCIVDAGWAPWLQGFSLALWLRLEPDTKSDETNGWHDDLPEPETNSRSSKKEQSCKQTELLHLFSVGHDSLMFELWISANTGELAVRLTRPEGEGSRQLGAARARLGACPRWRCVALRVAERVLHRRIHIQVTLYVDGRELETLSIPLQGILVRKATPSCVLVGHAAHAAHAAHGPGTASCGAVHVGGVRLYRAPVLGAVAALHVAAHPPDLPCQIPCENAHFPSIITPELLEMDIDWDSVYEISSTTLRELHDSLLLSFAPHAPDVMNLYNQPQAMPTVFGGRSVGAGSSPGEPPEAVRVQWAGAPRAASHRGLVPALLALGGPDVLLYLFARVVELDGTAEEQAAALGVLLRAGGADGRLAGALHAALPALLPVLASAKCRVTHHLLQVILDEACSSPVLVSSSANGCAVTLLARNDSIILEPRLLLLLMQAWRHFDTEEVVVWEVRDGAGGGEGPVRRSGSTWGLALAALGALLSNTRASFNRYQAARLDLLRHLLLACKERFLNSECPALDADTSGSLVALVAALVGSPPPLCNLALLCDFLLLMHQASDTFVTHSRANFYFLLTADTPETSDFNFLNFINKRNKSLKTNDNRRSYDAVDKSSSSSVSNEDVTIELNSLKELTPNRETESDKTDPDSGVESTKLMKGMINLQIREGRQKLSSTSENSDGASTEKSIVESGQSADADSAVHATHAEHADAQAAHAEEALSGYIVVDSDEVSHTTVDIYTSGIYQQRRVRAGAEPGWRACEGLLLLLRDALAALPHDQLEQALLTAIQPETLVVLANHASASVRGAVVRVACAVQRAQPALLAAAMQRNCYLHLANQISLYPCSWELAGACAALLTGCDAPLEDQLDEGVWAGVDGAAAARSPPLLALLPLCARAALVPLAHNIAALLRRLLQKSTLKALSEVSLAEVVVRAVRAAGMEGEGFEGRELLLQDLCDLLCRLAVKVLAEGQTTQMVVDMHNMLRYIECEDVAGAGGAGGVQLAARHAQAALFAAQLDHLEMRLRMLSAHAPKQTNYFTTVLSAVEGVGGRSEAAEAAARLGATLARAAAFLTSRPPRAPLPEADLFDRVLQLLLAEATGSEGSTRRSGWSTGGATCSAALSELFWWAVSPAREARGVQARLLRALYRAPAHAPDLLAPRHRDPAQLRKLSVYLLTLVQQLHLAAEAGAEGVELALTDWARDWAVSAQAELAERVRGPALQAEAERLLRADRERRARRASAPRLRAAIGKSVFSKEGVARALADAAMAGTRRVVEAQNAERKAFLDHLRTAHALSAAAHARWLTLIDAHTHERGVWHNPAGYPGAWQLDSTEGPGRVRVRLRRAHLRIPPRFLQPPHRHKAESALHGGPLRSVLGAARGGLAARLQPSETVAYTARVVRVTVASEDAGELLLTDRCIHFVPEERSEEEAGNASLDGGGAESWPLSSVARVATRRWCLQERALELFLSCGRALLLAFADTAERAAFLAHLPKTTSPHRTESESLQEAMNQWRNGAITNWEYLMTLNGLAGRSYNDLMQYPVLPFIIADYTSKILDLTDPASFRDLSKPMAVQNKKREQHYINTYNDLKAARREGCSPLLSRQPHHYASLYSNSGGVLHYLVRLPPFTELFLNYQDNNFDMPDRTFHSLATTWRLITNDSPTDVKELIPELFYLPELFYNNEGLELGVRQCGARVDDVQLPRWAADARLFTLAHRQALEAAHVAERLPHWIDLVFGYKQTGQAAVDAINVFPACTYYGFDPSSLEDEVDRTAAAAMVRTYGQAPRQLLRAPHPQRAPDLQHSPPQASVWAGVKGARWGRYCGSPACAAPALVGRRALPGARALQALAHPRAVAVCPGACVLLMLRDDSSGDGGSESLCAVSWAHGDGVVRLRRRREQPPAALLHTPALDQVTAAYGCSSGGGGGAAGLLGLSSGRVLALCPPRARPRALHAHTAPLSAVLLCARASLVVTASVDGLIVLWDLNELSYIRTLPNRDMLPVRCVAVSETLSDVATAHDPAPAGTGSAPGAATDEPGGTDAHDEYERDATYKYKSLIRVHTVNGKFVGSVKVSEAVSCLCYSNAPEGVSVNCVAAGLASGGVRLYSSWTLRPVVYIAPPHRPSPLVSITYSSDSSLLFASCADGTVLAWESVEAGARAAPVRMLPALALL